MADMEWEGSTSSVCLTRDLVIILEFKIIPLTIDRLSTVIMVITIIADVVLLAYQISFKLTSVKSEASPVSHKPSILCSFYAGRNCSLVVRKRFVKSTLQLNNIHCRRTGLANTTHYRRT